MFYSVPNCVKVQRRGDPLFCESGVTITRAIGAGPQSISRELKHESRQALTVAGQPDKTAAAEAITQRYLVPETCRRPMACACKWNIHRTIEFLKIVHKPREAGLKSVLPRYANIPGQALAGAQQRGRVVRQGAASVDQFRHAQVSRREERARGELIDASEDEIEIRLHFFKRGAQPP